MEEIEREVNKGICMYVNNGMYVNIKGNIGMFLPVRLNKHTCICIDKCKSMCLLSLVHIFLVL